MWPDNPFTTLCAQKAIIWKKFISLQPFVVKSPKIHRISPIPGRYPGNSGFSANARARSRDSAPRGQGGGSPPCTYWPPRTKNNVWKQFLFPLLGPQCTVMPDLSVAPYTVGPYRQTLEVDGHIIFPSPKNNRLTSKNSPHRGQLGVFANLNECYRKVPR